MASNSQRPATHHKYGVRACRVFCPFFAPVADYGKEKETGQENRNNRARLWLMTAENCPGYARVSNPVCLWLDTSAPPSLRSTEYGVHITHYTIYLHESRYGETSRHRSDKCDCNSGGDWATNASRGNAASAACRLSCTRVSACTEHGVRSTSNQSFHRR